MSTYPSSRRSSRKGRPDTPDVRDGARYRALLDAIDDGFCVVQMVFDDSQRAVDYRFLDINPAFQRETGLVDARGQLMRDLVPEHEQYWFDLYGHVALTGEPVRFERHAAMLADRWFNVLAFRVDEPEAHHVAILFRDVSDRRRAAHERDAARDRERETNALLDALSESAPIGLAFLDPELRFRRLNPRLAEMNGLSIEAHLGKRPDEVLRNLENLPEMLARWDEVVRSGNSWLNVEVRGETHARPGDVRTWSESFFPVRVRGRIVGLGCAVEDITERKRAEEALAASEARFRRLVELGPVGIAVSEPDGQVVLANDALLAMLGYRRDELPLLNWRERTPPEYLERDEAGLEALRRGETPGPFEKVYVRRDGTRVPVMVVAQFLPGEGERTIAYALDMTERKRAQSALRESEAQLRRLIDNMAVFVAMLDRDGTLLEVGEPALQVGGLRREQVLGRKFWECGWWLHDREQQNRIRQWIGDAAQGATVRQDVTVRTANDGRMAIDCMLAPVFDSEGKVTHVIPSGIDISARKRMETALLENEARLSQAASALQDADRRKDEFLATLAHELRNPLAPIRNGVQLLRLVAGDDQTLRRTTEMMDRQVNHLVRLVDDLLDVSRITRGKIELRREPVTLNHVLRNALESCDTLFEPNGHTLHVEIPPEPVMVAGDPDRLTQVFANLLSNAAKFTPSEGTVWLSMRAEGEQAVVIVRDSGIGIPEDRLQTVFDMFSQAHGPRVNDGLGIGLALVRQLLHMHLGSVTAESGGEGRGSQFTVRLPLLRSSTTEAREPRSAVAASAPVAPLRERRILVVDDNADAAESLGQLLRMHGQKVAICSSGEAAIELARTYQPQLIFMDIGMPGMDGLAATRRIRAQPGGAAVRIIALTGWGQEDDRQRTHDAGLDDHLVKPVQIEALVRILQNV